MTPLVFGLVVLAGGLGAVIRVVIQRLVAGSPGRPERETEAGSVRPGPAHPAEYRSVWAIFGINVAASFVAGFALSALPPDWAAVAIVGFCGGMSTWSTVMLDALALVRDRAWLRLVIALVAQIAWGLFAALAGIVAGTALLAGM